MLFGGEDQFAEALTGAILDAPQGLAPLATLFHAFQKVEPIFVQNRSFSSRRQVVIASNPALEERAQTKRHALITVEVRSRLMANDFVTLRAAAIAGDGIAMLPRSVARIVTVLDWRKSALQTALPKT